MEKLRIQEVVVVEGKYDAIKLADLVDALIVPVGGFSVFTSKETKQLLRRLGEKRGLVILTDSDAAGFRVRAYLNQLAQDLPVKNAYIPACEGKEKRKAKASKEGLLGVEGVSTAAILQALERAGVQRAQTRAQDTPPITYADLYEQGLSGTDNSAAFRRAWLDSVGIPPRISKKGLLEALNSIFTKDEFLASVSQMREHFVQ